MICLHKVFKHASPQKQYFGNLYNAHIIFVYKALFLACILFKHGKYSHAIQFTTQNTKYMQKGMYAGWLDSSSNLSIFVHFSLIFHIPFMIIISSSSPSPQYTKAS